MEGITMLALLLGLSSFRLFEPFEVGLYIG
jgi:hypothetical protein